MNPTDRLGDAIREIARGMTEHGKTRIEIIVVAEGREAVYEVRLLCTRPAVQPAQRAERSETPASGPGQECPR